jgi:hypothetical protein
MASREACNYESVLIKDIPLKVMLNALPTKGRLVYEYNPFRNYRLTENKYLYKNNYYKLEELDKEFKIYPYYLDGSSKIKWTPNDVDKIPIGWIDNLGKEITEDPP